MSILLTSSFSHNSIAEKLNQQIILVAFEPSPYQPHPRKSIIQSRMRIRVHLMHLQSWRLHAHEGQGQLNYMMQLIKRATFKLFSVAYSYSIKQPKNSFFTILLDFPDIQQLQLSTRTRTKYVNRVHSVQGC